MLKWTLLTITWNDALKDLRLGHDDGVSNRFRPDLVISLLTKLGTLCRAYAGKLHLSLDST